MGTSSSEPPEPSPGPAPGAPPTSPSGAGTGPRHRRRGRIRAAIEGVLPRERFGDQRDILGGAGQNVVGLVVGGIAQFAAQVLVTRTLGPERYGVVTAAVQAAFIGAAATRFGMDVADVRLVAILVGRGAHARVRPLVNRSVAISASVSLAVAAAVLLAAEPIAGVFTDHPDGPSAFRAAALALPFAAVAQTYLGATRGLKIMRHTLSIFWIGQWLAWIGLSLLLWLVARTVGMTVLAYAGSWGLATFAALWAWERESRGFPSRAAGDDEPIPEERTAGLLRFGALRAPATLFSQLLFWTDFYVLATLANARDTGIYGAAIRAAQSLLLFLTSLSLMFSPFVADLHARGERDRLDGLYKSVTRWTLAATLPVLLVLLILPEPILRIFGGDFDEGSTALLILIAGMVVPVSVGTVGFILIMVGRTGWDLLVYAGSFVLDVGLALALARPERLGIE
ncbi:MAG: oligosaccharide flippase family protein, partial [Actinobacteria bacterium]|nr:oligosaccharide flippase family protein [Actinomycetota bacterium]